MPKRPAAFYRPSSLEKALQLLANPEVVPLAGGTALLAGDIQSAVVDLQDLGLDNVELQQGRLTVGAMVRLTDLARFLKAKNGGSAASSLLAQAIHQAGPNTYRNAATVGGIVASRLADSELLAALLVMNAELVMFDPDPGQMSLVDYLRPASRPMGLLTEISLEWSEGLGGSERVARTPADYPIVSVTAWQPFGRKARLAATGIDVRPIRLEASEAELTAGMDEASVASAAAAAKARAKHPGDFRGDPSYRAEMAAVLTRRVLARWVS